MVESLSSGKEMAPIVSEFHSLTRTTKQLLVTALYIELVYVCILPFHQTVER